MNIKQEIRRNKARQLKPRRFSEWDKSQAKTKPTDISSDLLSSVSSKLYPNKIQVSGESRVLNVMFQSTQMKINCIDNLLITKFSLNHHASTLDFEDLRSKGAQKKLKNLFAHMAHPEKLKKICSEIDCPLKRQWKDKIFFYRKQMKEAEKFRQKISEVTKNTCAQIQKDAYRSFPDNMLTRTKIILYHVSSDKFNLIDSLKTVLKMLVLLDPEVGYVQGMNLYVAHILSHMKDIDSCFAFVKQIMKYGHFRTMYINNFQGLKDKTQEFLHRHVKILMNDLYDHFIESEIKHEFFMPYYLSMFASVVDYHYMPVIIDQFLSKGFSFLQKLMLSTLCYLKQELLQVQKQQVALHIGISYIKSQNLPWEEIINLTQAIQLN